MISLPLFDAMTYREVDFVAKSLKAAMNLAPANRRWSPKRSEEQLPLAYRGVNATGEVTVE